MSKKRLTYEEISHSLLYEKLISSGLVTIELTRFRGKALINLYEKNLLLDEEEKYGFSKLRSDWNMICATLALLYIILFHRRLLEVFIITTTWQATIGWEIMPDGHYVIGLLSGKNKVNC